MGKRDAGNPDLTIVGGQPLRGKRRDRMAEVPAGLEQLLYLAARDRDLEERLYEDRQAALDGVGIELCESEKNTLLAVSDQALKSMIGRIEPANPRGRKIMKLVAAAAASLAAGTATIHCDDPDDSALSGGANGDVDVDGDTDTDTDGDTDTDTDSDSDI